MPPGEAPLRGRDAYRFVLSNPDFDVCMTGPRNDAELNEALAFSDASIEERGESAYVWLAVKCRILIVKSAVFGPN